MKVLAELPIKEALRKSLLNVTKTRKINANGKSFSVAHLRTFAMHGRTCVRCGREGDRLLAWEDEGGGIHVDLFAKGKNGPILMNRDHIIPKSKKGSNTDWNYQTMCIKCNCKKGNMETAEDRKLAEFRIHWRDIHVALHDGYWQLVPKFLRWRWLTKYSLTLRATYLHRVSYVLARLTA